MIPTQKFSKRLGNRSVFSALSIEEIVFSSFMPLLCTLLGLPILIQMSSFFLSLVVLGLRNSIFKKGQLTKTITKKDYIHIEKIEVD